MNFKAKKGDIFIYAWISGKHHDLVELLEDKHGPYDVICVMSINTRITFYGSANRLCKATTLAKIVYGLDDEKA